jgi:hypothetical protein
VPFNRALAPGQCHRGLDGGQVRPEPCGKAPEGREGALGGVHQPWFKVCGLALADEGGEVLRERHRLCQFGRRLGQLVQQMLWALELVRAVWRRPRYRRTSWPRRVLQAVQVSLFE